MGMYTTKHRSSRHIEPTNFPTVSNHKIISCDSFRPSLSEFKEEAFATYRKQILCTEVNT